MLDKKSILSKTSIETKIIHVEAWGADVTIKKLTIKEREIVDTILYGNATLNELQTGGVEVTTEKFTRVSTKTASFALVNEDGTLMFSEEEIYAMNQDARPAITEIYEASRDFDKPKK